MAAIFKWAQRYGAPAGTLSELGPSGNLFNFKNADDATAANYTTYPITAGRNSFDVWLQGKFTGTFNKVQNVQFWKSSGAYGAGEVIQWDPATPNAYAQPATGAIGGGANIPSGDPGSANVSIGDAAPSASELTASGYSDYLVLQLQTTTGAEAGDTDTFSYTMQYDEN